MGNSSSTATDRPVETADVDGRGAEQYPLENDQNIECLADQEETVTKPRYVYEPISATSQIRLIRFSSSKESPSSINMSLHSFSLRDDDCPNFATLSYVWGLGGMCEEVCISGSPLSVTKNLFEVLQALRPSTDLHSVNLLTGKRRYRYYWIDAICIDQNNLAERGMQVSLMGEIYSRSVCTVVWLGGEFEASGRAMDLIKEFGGADAIANSNACVTASISKVENRPAWVALDRLFRRPYWQRTWIRQEYVLSQKLVVHCGDRWCEGLELQNALLCLSRALNFYTGIKNLTQYIVIENDGQKDVLLMGNPGFEVAKSARDMRIFRATLKIRLPLLSVLIKSKGIISTDARDRIYGVLGMASDREAMCAAPNYTAPVAKVYAELVRAQIREYSHLDVICFGRPDRIELGLPSWVPDWSAQSEVISYMVSNWARLQEHKELVAIGKERPEDEPELYRASADYPCRVEFSSDLTLLSTSGLHITTIDGLGYASGTNKFECNLIQSSAPTSEASSASIVSRGLQRTIARSLLCGRRNDKPISDEYCISTFNEITVRAINDIQDPGSHFPSWFKRNSEFLIQGRALADWVKEWTADHQSYAQNPLSIDARSYTLDAAAVMYYYRKRLMTTTDGDFGMAPHTSQPGDQVWVLFGCSVPVVLRPCGERFELVGECYVDSYMDGLAMVEFRTGKREKREVVLQ